jgi:hypothetical protein
MSARRSYELICAYCQRGQMFKAINWLYGGGPFNVTSLSANPVQDTITAPDWESLFVTGSFN